MGEAKITGAYNLPCEYVIHTVGPRWHGGERNEAEILAACYENSLNIALDKGIERIAFPSISTGAFGYPTELAAEVAVKTVNDFLLKHSDKVKEVYFILFDNNTCKIFQPKFFKILLKN